jgi:hypothetical protein
MLKTRFVWTLVSFVLLSLTGLVAGCSGSSEPGNQPPDAAKIAENKRIAEETRAVMKAEAAERKKAMRGGRGGR